MRICNGDKKHKHEDCCIEDRGSCPACDALEQLENAEDEIIDLKAHLAYTESDN